MRKTKRPQKRYYIAYGSNLNILQMLTRCPDAKIVGTAELEGWQLLFKGSKTGFYLTIEKEEFCTVPVAVWEISPSDEQALDIYEGYPHFYYKYDIELSVKSVQTKRKRKINAFAYIMKGDRPIGMPTRRYWETCNQGYRSFNFDPKFLEDALEISQEVCYG